MNFRLEMIIISLILIFFILYILKKNYLSIKYSTVWLFSCLLMLLFSLFPDSLEKVSHFLGFEVLSNMIFFIMIGILFFITISLTVIVSSQRKKIDLLIQEISLLKMEYNNDKKNNK